MAWMWHTPKSIKKKLIKITKLTDIVTSALAVFGTSLSKVLNNCEIDEQEFQVLQALHLKAINELSNADLKMESETRNKLQKSLLEEMIEIKKTLRTRDTSSFAHSFLFVILCVT